VVLAFSSPTLGAVDTHPAKASDAAIVKSLKFKMASGT
jgi:hypothetical protein